MCLANRKPEKRPKRHAKTENRRIASRGSARLAVSDAHIALQGPGYLEPRRWVQRLQAAIRNALISDIHGPPRTEAMKALEGCGPIIHAGDAGKPEIIGNVGFWLLAFSCWLLAPTARQSAPFAPGRSKRFS
jgi:hypothetical protein